MSRLGEQIAVLDGLTIAPGDGSYGGGSSYPDRGRWPLLPSNAGLNGPLGAQNDLEAVAKRVFASASGGAQYSGGSSYPDSGQFPLLSSTVGLAGFAAAGYPRDLPNVAPRKRVFASYSGGSNYSGGSSYPDSGRFPTWAQAGAGLAACGCPLNGLGTMPNVLPGKRVFASASGSSNYSGGSSYPDSGRFPLLSSTVGLAGNGARRAPMTRAQLMAQLQFHAQQMANIKRAMSNTSNAQARAALKNKYNMHNRAVCVLRAKAGLPMLPECKVLLARMRKALEAKKAQQRRGAWDQRNPTGEDPWR